MSAVSGVVLRWWRSGSEVVHLARRGASAAYCGVALHDATAVASNMRVCSHCRRSRTYQDTTA